MLHDEVFFLLFCNFVIPLERVLNHLDTLLGDVAAEKAIERAAKDVREQIAKGAADCK